MAQTIGGGAAYQRLQVPDDGLQQSIQFWGAQKAATLRGIERGMNDRKAEKAKKVKEWEDTFNLKEGDFENKFTGFKSFDDMNTDFAMYMTDEYVNLQRQAKEALLNGDLKKKSEIEGEMIRRKNMFKEAAKSQEFFSTKFNDYQKAVAEGKVSGASKDFEDVVQEGILNHNLALRVIDGNLVYTGMKTDEDGDRVPIDPIPYQSIMDGSFSWYEKQELKGKDGLIGKTLATLGTIKKESAQGYYNITEQSWDDKIHGKATRDQVKAMMSSDEVMGDLLYQLSDNKTAKMFNFTDEEYKLVEDKLTDLVKASYSEEYGVDFESGKYSADTRRAMQKDDEDDATIEAEPMTDEEGNLTEGLVFPSTNGKQFYKGGGYTLRTKDGSPVKGIIESDPKAEVLSVWENEGKYYAQVRESQPEVESDPFSDEPAKPSTPARTYTKTLSTGELNRLARDMKLPTAGDMDDYLKSRREAYQKRTGGKKDPLGLNL